MSYHDEDELSLALDEVARRDRARIVDETIGSSHQGRPIRALTVSAPGADPGDGGRPSVLVTANIHGVEVIGSEVALEICDLLTVDEPTGGAGLVLERADVTVVPVVNPDGRAHAFERRDRSILGGLPRRTNDAGVDLNRNFPYPAESRDVWHPVSGTGISFLPWYRGHEPLDQPESAAVAAVARRLRPRAALALHSVGRLFLYPWCRTRDDPLDKATFERMGAAFRAAQPRWKYQVRQSAAWYAILGDLDDWLYDELGTLAVTVEISPPGESVRHFPTRAPRAFWWANPHDPKVYARNDADACLRALAEAFA